MAHSWEGWAWTWLRLVAAGIAPADRRKSGAILGRLRLGLLAPPAPGLVSHLSGSGGLAVVAAVGVRHAGFPELLPSCIKRWSASYAKDGPADLMTGAAGGLLACAEVEKEVPGSVPRRFLRDLHETCLAALELQLQASTRGAIYLGASHGLAGILCAAEVSSARFGLRLPSSLRRGCLDRLVKERRHGGRGGAAAWPILSGQRDFSYKGWCHGGPGIGLSCLIGYKLTGWKTYQGLARAALKGAVLFRRSNRTFCCGSAGRAHILIEAYRLTGETFYLKQARGVAAEARPRRWGALSRGFHQGSLGGLSLRWRLEHPRSLPLLGYGFLGHD